ncbi:MAG TPA: hypothetical protein VGA31_06945 [Thermoanaerobaculia bacterium]
MRIFAAATIAATLLSFPQTGLAVGPGDLSGTWKLDRDRSDDPAEKLREGGGSSRRGSGGGGGFRGRRGGGGFGGHHGRSTDEGEQNGGTDFLQDSRAFDLLSIVHRDPELRITDGLGREHVLYTDGRRVDEERSSGTTKIRAKWKDGRVVVATTPEHGAKITETYAGTADGSSLTVTTRVEGRGREIEFRRVYNVVK